MYAVFLSWFIVSFMFKMKTFIDEILEFINKLYYMYFILYYNTTCKSEIVCFDLVYTLKWSWMNYVTLIKWNDIFNKNTNNWWILDKTWWWFVTAEQVVDLYIGKKNLRVLLQDALSAKSLIGWIQKAQNRKCPYISTY